MTSPRSTPSRRTRALAALAATVALVGVAACGGGPSEGEVKAGLEKAGLPEPLAACVAKGLNGDTQAMEDAMNGKTSGKVEEIASKCVNDEPVSTTSSTMTTSTAP